MLVPGVAHTVPSKQRSCEPRINTYVIITKKMRPATKCGQWYSKSPHLEQEVDEWLSQAKASLAEKVSVRNPDDIRFIISPHAGLVYSGPIAAYGYSLIDPSIYDRVLILGVCHAFHTPTIVCSPFTEWENPYPKSNQLIFERIPGLSTADHRGCMEEHSIELQIPFLARVFAEKIQTKQVAFSAAYCGGDAPDSTLQLLVDYMNLHKTLLVASSDFIHFGRRFGYVPRKDGCTPAKVVTDIDMLCFEAVTHGAQEFIQAIAKTGATICGRFTISTALRLFEAMKVRLNTELLRYGKSDEPEDYNASSVSYVSAIATVS